MIRAQYFTSILLCMVNVILKKSVTGMLMFKLFCLFNLLQGIE